MVTPHFVFLKHGYLLNSFSAILPWSALINFDIDNLGGTNKLNEHGLLVALPLCIQVVHCKPEYSGKHP